jgi:hypothetical protein
MESFDEMTPEFQDKAEEVYFAIAVMGEDARRFFSSAVGKYVVGRAYQRIEAIKEQLIKTPAWRRRKIQSLQNEAKAVKMGIVFLQEAVEEGEYAHEELKKMQ